MVKSGEDANHPWPRRHVLSNVGRVAARDSSRTTATVNDLFTALCEDASMYGYFRTMKGALLRSYASFDMFLT